MTPKEKAEELLKTFALGGWPKENSLIAVDELIENQNRMQDFLLKEIGYLIPSATYWKEVKKELEKI